jgi:hypothetical protein
VIVVGYILNGTPCSSDCLNICVSVAVPVVDQKFVTLQESITWKYLVLFTFFRLTASMYIYIYTC